MKCPYCQGTGQVEPASTGAAITFNRVAAGLSQTQLAAKIGMSKQAVSALEKGSRDPTMSTLRKIAGALGIQTKELLP